MRVLWVKPGGIWPLTSGGRLRSYHIISELARRNEMTILTTHAPADDPARLSSLIPGARVLSFPHAAPKRDTLRFAAALCRSWASPLPVDVWKWRVPGLRQALEGLLDKGEADVTVADFLTAVGNLRLPTPCPVIYFAHNVEHMIWRRLARLERKPWRKLLLEVEWRKMRKFEAAACNRAHLVMSVSEVDRELLRSGAPQASRIAVVPTGVDTSYFVPNVPAEKPNQLVFTGSMDWYPNEEGMSHFITEILPLIRQEIPQVSITAVGRNPSARLLDLKDHGRIRITGTVKDIRPYVHEAAVYVVPIRVGGGTRLKIFEALAMGKAVVSTRLGAEGLPLVAGEHFVRADEPAHFAQAVVSLLREPARRRAIGLSGRRLVEEHFSWTKVSGVFEDQCKEVMKRHAN